MKQRRHDIDWLRVIAIGLLIIYHSAISFQPWAGLIGFIQDKKSIEWIWYPMAMLNMWRIPILFFVSGMGVYFSMKKRNAFQLLKERIQRILLPFLFGIIVIVPLQILIWQKYYYQDLDYQIEQGHLWFLLNIFVYTLLLISLFPIIKNEYVKKWILKIRKISGQPLVFTISIALLIMETYIVKPEIYTLYAFTIHGWVLGLVSFALGFYIVSLGENFCKSFNKSKWVYLIVATSLYFIRILLYNFDSPYYLSAIETITWVFTVFGFFYQYFNHHSNLLEYLRKAAYPVYIIHMVIQFGISSILFLLGLNTNLNLIILIIGTLITSIAIYHFIIRPIKWIRPLFGLNF